MREYKTVVLGDPVAQDRPRFSRQGGFVKAYDPTTRPDVSNVLKGVEDALKGLWYVDDSQIVGYEAVGKWYDKQPRIEITMWEIPTGREV